MKNWKKFVGGCLTAGMLALFGCGGGSGSSVPATATGKFIDAPVVGLSYVSGGQKGVTGADGSFTYEVGKPVKFSIGGIVLGEAPAKALMTPIDLSTTTGAVATTPDVLARVQLLMSLSSTDPASGTITILPAILTAAQVKSMNFASTSTTMQADLQVIVTALAPTKTMVTPGAAQTHFAGTLSNIFIASMLSGKTIYNYSSTSGNTGTITMKSDGTFTGTQNGVPTSGTWSINSSGQLVSTSPGNSPAVMTLLISAPPVYTFSSSQGNVINIVTFTDITGSTPPAPGFTNAMLAGHTATVNFTKGPTAFVFAATGNTVTTSGITGTWVINTNGTLTVTFPSDSLTFTIVSGSGNNLIVTDTHAATPTLVEGPDTMTII